MESRALEVGGETAAPEPFWLRIAALNRARSTIGSRPILVAALVLLLTVLAFGTLGAMLTAAQRDRVLPAVWVADVAVGGLGEAAARERVEDRIAALAARPVTLAVGDRTWTPLPAELGIGYDAAAGVERAMAAGREQPVGGLLRLARLEHDVVTVPLPIRFDRGRFAAYFDRLDAELGTPPVDATVTLAGTEVVVTPAREGRALDRAAAQAVLLGEIVRLQPVALQLALGPAPAAIGDDQAAAVKSTIDRALAAPLILSLHDRDERTLVPEEIARLVRVTTTDRDGRRTLLADLDPAALDALVAEIGREIDAPTSEARVDDLGTHQRLVPAVRGRTLRRADLAGALRSAFAAGEHRVALPIDEDPAVPAVTTDALVAELGVADLIADGDSDFAGSDPARAANVRLAAERVDGTLVPPGGSFSFNAAVGSLFDTGFVAAPATIEGIPGDADGGGVCQVSTTIFRAALRAGLPIEEWWPHSFRSPFYEQGGWSPGFDASIVQVEFDPAASSDFRFANPTDGWLLVRVLVENGTALRVELRGVDPGYQVSFEGPFRETTEWAPPATDEIDQNLAPGEVAVDRAATDGERYTLVRRVLDADGNEIAVDTFVSSYAAQGALRRVGPSPTESA